MIIQHNGEIQKTSGPAMAHIQSRIFPNDMNLPVQEAMEALNAELFDVDMESFLRKYYVENFKDHLTHAYFDGHQFFRVVVEMVFPDGTSWAIVLMDSTDNWSPYAK